MMNGFHSMKKKLLVNYSYELKDLIISRQKKSLTRHFINNQIQESKKNYSTLNWNTITRLSIQYSYLP